MGIRRRLARVAVAEVFPDESPDPDVTPLERSPLRLAQPRLASRCAAAMLKVSRELRQSAPVALDELLDRVLEGTAIDRDWFRGYVDRNLSLLRRS